MKFLSGFAILSALLATPVVAAPPGLGGFQADSKPESQVIVLYRDDTPDLPLSPEDIVATVNDANPTAREQLILSRFQMATRARFLIGDRLPVDVRATYPKDHPRARLQRYVVLTYANPGIAQSVVALLKKDHNFISVTQNATWHLHSVNTNDPLAAPNQDANTSQWGLDSLNLRNAWAVATGYGYVGVVDTGIAVNHEDLGFDPLNHPNDPGSYRPQLSHNYGEGTSLDDADSGANRTPTLVGHGTHVAGIIAAKANNGKGGVGVCWGCSLMIAKATVWDGALAFSGLDSARAAAALSFLAGSGAQVINMSFGADPTQDGAGGQHWSDAIAWANAREIVLVASVGNFFAISTPDYPASDPNVFPVGGLQYGNVPWHETTANNDPQFPPKTTGQDTGTQAVPVRGVMAPARQVWSTVYPSKNWVTEPHTAGAPVNVQRCGDDFPDTSYPGYGWCTGTSMATPYISGLAAIVRSIRPLQTQQEIRDYITSNADNHAAANNSIGAGRPDALASVNAALDGYNGLTPLFAFKNESTHDTFYTTVPQMGATAITGDLLPYVNGSINTYTPVGITTSPTYTYFRGGYPPGATHNCDSGNSNPAACAPLAQVWIFSTQTVPPGGPQLPLVPLYRWSYSCGFADTPKHNACTANPYHVDHAYTTNIEGNTGSDLRAKFYKLDGIEGYIYPNIIAQPSGTVGLYQFYNPTWDDYAIFPSTEYTSMYNQGWNNNGPAGENNLGWVYLNTNGVAPSTSPPRPATPITYTPSGAWSTNAPTYTWQYLPDATSYRLFSGNGAFFDLNITQAHCTNGTTCWYTPFDPLAYSTTYTWSVNATYAYGTSDPSPARSFTTPAAPVTPAPAVLVSPNGANASRSPVFTWQPGARTTTYGVYVADSAGYAVINVALSPSDANCANNVGTCSYAATDTVLPPASNYTWDVISSNPSGSLWSTQSLSFATVGSSEMPGYPMQLSPSGYGTVATTPTYTWRSGAPETSTYYLNIMAWDGSYNVNLPLTPAQANCGPAGGTCHFTPNVTLNHNAAYMWQVSAVNNVGTTYGGGITFTTVP